MYAGVEFGNSVYQKRCDSLTVVASSATNGGLVEVYIDSIDANRKIGECLITGTGSWTTFQTFTAKLSAAVSGTHDVYLLFTGSVFNKLFMLQSFNFTGSKGLPVTSVPEQEGTIGPRQYMLEQNYPNPFNPSTHIGYNVAAGGNVQLKVYDMLGREIATLVDEYKPAGYYSVQLPETISTRLASGVYYYTLRAGNVVQTKKMTLAR